MPQARWKAGDTDGAGDLFIFCFVGGGERGHGGMRDGPGVGVGGGGLQICTLLLLLQNSHKSDNYKLETGKLCRVGPREANTLRH